MAIKQTNIFPIDTQPRKAVGLAFPFSSPAVSGSTPFKLNYTTRDQLKSNLVIYFSTNKGERPLNPNYGGGLRNLLFEQLTPSTYNNAEQIIREELALQFPEVQLKTIEIFGEPERNILQVVMSYTVFNNEEDTVEINLTA
jgi:phage baseplate assembly protein W